MFELEGHEAKAAFIDTLAQKGLGGAARRFGGRSIFTPFQERAIVAIIDMCADAGFPIGRRSVREAMLAYAAAEPELHVDPARGVAYKFSLRFVKNFMKRHSIKAYKTSTLHPTRARKATLELRDEWFGRVDAFVKKLYAQGLVPYASYDEWRADDVDRRALSARSAREVQRGRCDMVHALLLESVARALILLRCRDAHRTQSRLEDM